MNLQKLTFQAWLDPRNMKMFAPAQKIRSLRLVTTTRADFRMLEADALNRISQLDVDAEVVRVQLELVVGREPAVLLHVHRQRRDRTVERQLPVAIAARDAVSKETVQGVQRSAAMDPEQRTGRVRGLSRHYNATSDV